MNRKDSKTNPEALRLDELWKAIDRFRSWQSHEPLSYDPYDLAGTSYGCWARRLYYRKHPLGAVLNAPLVLMEIFAPELRAVFVKKGRFATADAQLALGFMNLYEAARGRAGDGLPGGEQAESFLKTAEQLAEALLRESVAGYSGVCWGYPFEWENVNGRMPKNTPHITATPYGYEAFARLFDVTGKQPYLEIARSIATFVDRDLHDTPVGHGAAAASYTPRDRSKVVNASSYRALVLADAARRFQNRVWQEKAQRNLEFILQAQRADGSWFYAIDNPPEQFIDHFHTCFVLKSLCKINRHLQSEPIRRALHRGYAYYRRTLFDAQDNPRSFAIAPRLQIVKIEMYNIAEAINLGVLLRDEVPEAFELALRLAARVVRQYQHPAGYWVTRIYRGGVRHTVPFIRWPQAQMFHALSHLSLAWPESAAPTGICLPPALAS